MTAGLDPGISVCEGVKVVVAVTLIMVGVVGVSVGATYVVEGGIDVIDTIEEVGVTSTNDDVESLVRVIVVVGDVVRLMDVVVETEVMTESVTNTDSDSVRLAENHTMSLSTYLMPTWSV
jgi:hypothetical protein